MSQPSKLVVQYDDGSARETEYAKIHADTRAALQREGLIPGGERVGTAKHYVLLRWKDGWQEVLGIDKDTVELLRYYVIERIDDRGRLSFQTGEDYPELVVLERTPRDVVAALVVGDNEVKSCALEESMERWEGIFDSGGKREYVKFDQTSDEYPHEVENDPARLEPVLEALRAELQKTGLQPAAVLTMTEDERVGVYKSLATAAGVRGCKRQEDVYGFLEAMMARLGVGR